MKRRIVYTLVIVWFTVIADAGRYTKYVNPFIGTGAVNNSLSGNTYPGAVLPFGMVQLSPDTREAPDWDAASGYNYNDSTIYGFSHTHLSGTGAADLIDILLMPTTHDDIDKLESSFSHHQETARPGYYKVKLKDGDIIAELSATVHTGIHRYTFPPNAHQRVMIDIDHSANKGSWNRRVISSQMRLVNSHTVEGYRIITGWARLRRVYFHAEFSKPVTNHVFTDGIRQESEASVINGTNIRGYFDFGNTGNNTEVVCKVALSAISTSNAAQNMKEEANGWNFQKYIDDADSVWENELSKIEVEGHEEDKQIFYTALYHALIQPNQMSDVNGQYMTADYTVKTLPEREKYYSTFSLWDTFRAAHPLYSLIESQRNADFVNSMIHHFDNYGYLPIWDLWGQENYCMIGNHAIPVILNAINNNTPGIDIQKAYKAVVSSCLTSHPGSSFETWTKYGYIPEDILSQSVSITLEQSFDDWCVAQFAKKMGRDSDFSLFVHRSNSYLNLYNPSTGFFQAKDSHGRWVEPFDPLRYGANGGNPYTEGNAWQYYWYVPQDVTQLIKLTGGRDAFVKKLDIFFSLNSSSGVKNDNASGFVGQYVHGNEPSHHVAYLYDYVGHPEKTQQVVSHILHSFYNTSSSGYAGNDDCGEMSSWYIFSAIGFYPVNPASEEYAIGTPLFDCCKIHLSNGNILTIITKRKNERDFKIKSIILNGKRLHSNFFRYSEIMNGGTITFNLEN